MRKIIYLLILLIPSVLQAQSISQQVVASAGDYVTGTNLTLSYTIGELTVKTLQTGSLTLTQGFQQPLDIGTFNQESMEVDWQVRTWPNPVSENLYLQVESDVQKDLILEVMDLSGRVHMVRKIEALLFDTPFRVDLSSMAGGVYLIKIRTDDHSIKRMVKILKQ